MSLPGLQSKKLTGLILIVGVLMIAISARVSNIPVSAPDDPPPPQIVNNVQSIEVIGISFDHSNGDRATYKLSLKNAGANDVDRVWFRTQSSGTSVESTLTGPPNKLGALPIKAGATVEYDIHIDDSAMGKATPSNPTGKYERKVTIRALLFTDGSYEGDVPTVAYHMATRAGIGIQISRIIPLMQKAIEDCKADCGNLQSIVNQLKEQIFSLPVLADQSTIDEIMAKYSLEGDLHKSNIRVSIQAGLKNRQDNELLPIGTYADKAQFINWMSARVETLKKMAEVGGWS